MFTKPADTGLLPLPTIHCENFSCFRFRNILIVQSSGVRCLLLRVSVTGVGLFQRYSSWIDLRKTMDGYASNPNRPPSDIGLSISLDFLWSVLKKDVIVYRYSDEHEP